MGEIKTPVRKFEEVVIFTEDHTINDVLRWLRDETGGDFSEVKSCIQVMEEDDE